MSTLLFPTFPGMSLGVKRTTMWSTTVKQTKGGKEQRIAYWSIPRIGFEIPIEFTRDYGTQVTAYNTSGAAQATLYETDLVDWFVAQVQGRAGTFWLNDPRKVQPAYYIVGGSPVPAPALGTFTAGIGGGLVNGTYYYVITSVTAQGESIQSAEGSGVATNGSIVLNWTPVTGAIGYNIYGRTQGLEQFIAFASGQATSTYTDQGIYTPTGLLPQLQCRFDMDDLELDQMVDWVRVWQVKTLKMISVK